jgi:hypothetical protein
MFSYSNRKTKIIEDQVNRTIILLSQKTELYCPPLSQVAKSSSKIASTNRFWLVIGQGL